MKTHPFLGVFRDFFSTFAARVQIVNKLFTEFYASRLDTVGKMVYIIDTNVSTHTLQVLKRANKRPNKTKRKEVTR